MSAHPGRRDDAGHIHERSAIVWSPQDPDSHGATPGGRGARDRGAELHRRRAGAARALPCADRDRARVRSGMPRASRIFCSACSITWRATKPCCSPSRSIAEIDPEDVARARDGLARGTPRSAVTGVLPSCRRDGRWGCRPCPASAAIAAATCRTAPAAARIAARRGSCATPSSTRWRSRMSIATPSTPPSRSATIPRSPTSR